VNNANIAVQNVPNPQGTLTPLDATNNWWGMPTGATHDGFSAGDAVGQNILFAPHLPSMPFPCDLASGDWIPFSEQELQFAINQNLPALRGIGFALLDMQWGYGAKFSLVSKPDYGSLMGEAFIRITPSPDGAFVTLTIDMSRLPTDPTLSQIATCELMPLFLNSIGQVQHKLAPTVNDIDHIVPMESNLMVRFAPNAPEITPEPAPPLVMNYDSSCLPIFIPTPTPIPSPAPTQDEREWFWDVQIPPIEGEFELMETGLEQSQTICGVENEPLWCSLLNNGEVFTYSDTTPDSPTAFISINRVNDKILTIHHVSTANNVAGGMIPSWGVKPNTNHSRLAFGCGGDSRLCYWDSISDSVYFVVPTTQGIIQSQISPNASKIVYVAGNTSSTNGYYIYDIDSSASLGLFNTNLKISDPRWSDSNTPYYFKTSGNYQNGFFFVMMSHLDDTNSIDLEGELHANFNNGNYRYDVHDGNVLYWSTGEPSGYDLWYYANNTNTFLLNSNKITAIHLSPDGSRFMLVYPKTTSSYCIREYEFANTDTFTEIACDLDFSYGVAWGGGGIDLSAFVDEPDVCAGHIGVGSWGFRKNPSEDASFEPTGEDPYIRNAPQVNVLGTNGTWYYIEYNNYEGWVVSEAVETIEAGCEPPLGTDDNSTGDFIRTEVIYDYQLELPQGFWSLRDEQIAIPDWDSASIEAKSYAKEWAYTYCQEGEHPQYWQPCSMIVFVIYYQLFEQIYGRLPMMSDILATGYEVEVSPFTQRGQYDLAEEALAGHYFQTIKEYCHHVLDIGEDITDVRIGENGCYNNTIPIIPSESLVMGWRRKDYTDNYNNQGYFWTLQAWYDQAICLREWYFGKQGEAIPDRTQITQLSELKGICNRDRPSILLASAAENKNIGLQQLTADKARNARFLDWANYAYDNATHNGYLADFNNPYNRAIRLWMVPEADETNDEINPEYPIQMELCQINLTHGEVIREGVRVPIWGEDVLVVIAKNGISAGLGSASTYDMSTHPRPAWLGMSSETAKFTSGPYRTCPCTVNDQRLPGTNFPFETRC